jgi:hypothetical protein
MIMQIIQVNILLPGDASTWIIGHIRILLTLAAVRLALMPYHLCPSMPHPQDMAQVSKVPSLQIVSVYR